MDAVPWFVAVGLILILLALTSSIMSRLPLSTSIVCLLLGIGLGRGGIGLLDLDIFGDAGLIERLTEVAVIVSLFTAGLQLRLPFDRGEWSVSLRLATLGMIVTIALVAGLGWFLGLPLGAAVILGAVLAPTDPVLASDVQVKHSMDSDGLRFVLTGEAGFNDGAAFPFVMLGLGLLGLHEIGPLGWRWWAVDVFWAVTVGLCVGAAIGTILGQAVLYLRLKHREALGLDNFLAVGLIALSYGVAISAHAYGFLAVFAAGAALRRVERAANTSPPNDSIRAAARANAAEDLATAQNTAPAYMAEAVVNFNAQLEHFAEVALVILIGSLLRIEMFTFQVVGVIVVLLALVRPVAAYASLAGVRMSSLQRRYIAWFGIRGIGSIYYLSYAIERGFRSSAADTLVTITLTTVATSILVHGISVTPLMNYYRRVSDTGRVSDTEGTSCG